MPFQKRLVDPSDVCRGTLHDSLPVANDLEAVTNGTLAHVIRQLSSLSRHAEDMFGELFREAERVVHRSNHLQARIDALADRVTRLDSTVEEVSLQDIHMRKAFRSRVVYDQEVFSRDTMPAAMRETYLSCDEPPPLQKLNVYRDDGKDGLKFYTDPNYFFQLWRQEMLRENDRLMHEKGKKPHRPRTGDSAASGGGSAGGSGGGRHKRRVRQVQNTRERHRQQALEQGEPLQLSPQQVQHNGLMPTAGADSPVSRYSTTSVAYQQQQTTGESVYSPLDRKLSRVGSSAAAGPDLRRQNSAQSNGTPSSSAALSRAVSTRPSQPPPAPPSAHQPGGRSGTGRLPSSSRDSLPPPPPPPPPPLPHPALLENGGGMLDESGDDMLLPPPPPVPDDLPPPPPPQQLDAAHPPPPPPMPPPPLSPTQHLTALMGALNGSAVQMSSGDVLASLINSPVRPAPVPEAMSLVNSSADCLDGSILSAPVHSPKATQQPQLFDARTDLLKAIRDGITLRKVEEVEGKRRDEAPLHDVASILARRVAIEVSDSNSGSDGSDSENWDEETSA